MSNFVDDVDLVDDCAPMPNETKPTLKSYPSGTAFISFSNNNQPEKSEPVKTGKSQRKQKRKSFLHHLRPSGAIQIGKNNLGATVFVIPKGTEKKMAEQPSQSTRKNASSFMQQSYQRGFPLGNYPKGIPKSFLLEAHQQSIGAPPGSGTPNAFPTSQLQQQIGQMHQQQIGQMHQQQIGQMHQQQIDQIQRHQQQDGQHQQQIRQLPSQQQNTGQTTQHQQQIRQIPAQQQNIGQTPQHQQQIHQTLMNIGFKQTFQPIEQKPSLINISLQKSGHQENVAETNEANKPLTRKQRFAEAKKKLRWVKSDNEKQDVETTGSKNTSANATAGQGLNVPTVFENQGRKKKQKQGPKKKRKRPSKNFRMAGNIPPNQTSAASEPSTAIQQQTSAPQQSPQQQTTIGHQQTTEQEQPTQEREPRQVYSPSDIYNESAYVESENEENNDDGDGSTPGSKRLSAFRRLGPVTQPKKPKMTINWLCNKDVRQVVETVEDEDVPVHLRKYLQMSTDDIVLRYLPRWPWINPPTVRRTVSARTSKSVMILEQEQMDDWYKKDNTFIQISITGYPDTWTKEDVLDAVLDSVTGHSFIPCFIEFSKSECKFLVIRNRTALLQLHKLGFVIKKDDVTLHVVISGINMNVTVLDFVPRLILMKRLSNSLNDTELDLKRFTLQQDVSHFIYFPLERQVNQIELLKLKSTVQWDLLTKLDLSYNKLTNLNGFFLKISTPKLKHLNLSYNNLEKISCLFNCRNLPLKSLVLEGNPLCSDYIEKEHYIKVLKMLFTELVEIDGINIIKSSEMPTIKQNYCSEEVQPIIERLLEVYFPLLEANVGERLMIQEMYDENAILTITHMPRLRYSPIYLDFRSLFKYARILEEDEHLSIKGSSNIAKVLCKWPLMEHDPYTFTVDLMYHMDTTVIFRIGGIFKLVSDSLAEDEPLLHFTRTFVLNSRDGVEYKICNDMVYWELPSKESLKAAFKSTSVWKRQPSLKFESAPDEELKDNLIQIFMNLTQMERNPSQKCLELKNWHLRHAMDYFINLLKLDNLDPIMK